MVAGVLSDAIGLKGELKVFSHAKGDIARGSITALGPG